MHHHSTGTTTHPAESTQGGHLHGRPACIQWLHPDVATTIVSTASSIIGRDASCSTFLEGKEISRQHAAIELDGPVVSIRDLASRNGLYVNARRVEKSPLVSGDVVRCGEWIGIVTAQLAKEPFLEIAPGWFGGAALQSAMAPARKAPVELPIVVEGETGTGKEGAARAIHSFQRRRGPIIAVNCATFPLQLAESELFGHRKGAFTGAEQASPGYFRSAERGTLFLDEILELPQALQPKLLRAIEQREVVPVGETNPVPIDVRIVVASQEALAQAVRAGRFRSDLYARLNGLTITLPPLRERREDIVPLTRRFLQDFSRGQHPLLCHKLVEMLCVYDWPMNVRELAQLVRRMLTVNGQDAVLRKKYLPAQMQVLEPPESSSPPPAQKREWRRTDDDSEFEQLVVALNQHQGSVSRAAAALGMQRSRAYRLLAAHPPVQLSGDRESRSDPSP